MSNPDEKNTVLGPPTDVTIGPEDLEDGGGETRDAEATPDENEDATESGELGGTEGAGGAG